MVRCVGYALGVLSGVLWLGVLVCSRSMLSGVLVGVPLGGARYASWKVVRQVVRCAELSFALHLAALVAAHVASHT